MPSPSLLGLHHVTAIAGDPERNLHFYTTLLGLRLVKITVNFDDPGSYHLYYGSGQGSPGSLLTFFPWPGAHRGSHSTGETGAIALAIPQGAAGFWTSRLTENQVPFTNKDKRILLSDTDGMNLQLVEAPDLDSSLRWDEGPVPAAVAIHGLHHVVLDIHASDVGASAAMLDTQLGLGHTGQQPLAEIAAASTRKRGQMGPGVIHHVAWRAAGDAEQQSWREQLLNAGLHVTPVKDRQYFHSIYFREPGGVLFEIATDNPGFLTDESYEELGTHLKLPPWLERQRSAIEASLPALSRQ